MIGGCNANMAAIEKAVQETGAAIPVKRAERAPDHIISALS